MAELEQQPLKKRKIYDAFISDSSSQSQTLTHDPLPPQTPPPSHEDLSTKLRNRDEVRNVHALYKRIKYCVDNREAAQLHQPYLSLIAASRGCVSAQRIAADLIPRYAPYCSASMEAAVEALISMYSSSMDILDRTEDDNGIAFDIAVACIVGLADIGCIAPSQSLKAGHGIRSSIFWNVLLFLLSALGKQDLCHFIDNPTVKMLESSKHFQELKQNVLDDDDKAISHKLMILRSLSIFRIFVCRPKDTLSACFDFMHTTEEERTHDKGLYLVRQMTTRSEANVSNRWENASDDMELCSGSSHIPASRNSSHGFETNTGNNDSKSCLLEMSYLRILRKNDNMNQQSFHSITKPEKEELNKYVLAKDHSLRNWLISKHNMLRGLVQSEDVSAINSAFECLLQSNGEAGTQEEGRQNCDEDTSATSSSSRFNPRNLGDVPLDVLEDQFLSPSTRNSSDLRREIRHVVNLNVLTDNNEDLKNGLSSHASGPIDGPNNASALPASGHETYSGNQITEFFDGDSEAMDVFTASKLLWVGSLTGDASEGYLRFQFERLGPIELVQVHADSSYAIVGFKYIMDAIKAWDYMRIHTPWDIRFSNGKGINPNSNVPVGSSPYVYVGNISSQWAKDEILYECRKVIHNGPCMITDLTREGALLLEFETPEEAARVMSHLRRYRKENIPPLNSGTVSNDMAQMDGGRTMLGSVPGAIGNGVLGNLPKSVAEALHPRPHPHQQPVSQSPADRRGITAQSKLGNNSTTTFNPKTEGGYRELNSPRLQPDNTRTLPQGGQATPSQWPASEADRRPLSGGYTEHMWMHTIPVNLSGMSAHGHVPQTPHFQSGQYMQPVFAPPSSSWDLCGGNQPMNVNQPSPGIVHNYSLGVTSSPFVSASTSPLTQQAKGNSLQGYRSVSSSFVVHPHMPDIPHPHPGMPPLPLCSPLPECPQPPPPLPLSSPKLQPQTPSTSHFSITGNAAPSTEYHWQGTLSKSGVRFCTIQAKQTESEICKYTNVSSEPSEWPSKFDMTKRTDFQHVKSTFKSTPPHKREVCRLFPSSSGDHKGFQDFISYLKQRNCVGVIKVPAGKSMWARLIFLLPYSVDICTFLSIPPNPSDCLIALVLPKEPGTYGS